MADIANLGVRFDTSELKEGKAALEAIAPAAKKAEQGIEGVAKASDNVAVAAAKGATANDNLAASAAGAASAIVKETNAAVAAAKAEDDRARATLLAAKASDTATDAEIKSLTAIRNKTQAALAAARADESEAIASLKAAAADNAQAAAAGRVAANQNTAAMAANKTGAATNSLTGQVGNLSAQFGDIAVQLAGGQSPFQIALQQGLQLIGIFGNAGLLAVIRGLGSAFLALVSPLSLITIGVITLGGYVVQYLVGWITQGSEANLTIKEQQELIRGLADAWGTGIPAIDAYIAKLDEAKEKTDALAAVKIVTGDAISKDVAIIQELNVALTAVRTDLRAYGDEGVNASNAVGTAFQTLIQAVSEGKATQEQFNAVLTAAQAAGAMGAGGVDTFIAALLKLQGTAIATTDIVNSTNAAIAQMMNKPLNDPRTWRGAGNLGNIRETMGDGTPGLPWEGPTPISRPSDLETDTNRGITASSGGGSSKGASSAKAMRTELQLLAEQYQKMSEPFNQAKSAFGALDAAYKNGSIETEAYRNQLDLLKASFTAAGGDAEQWAQVTASSTKKVSDATAEAKSITKGFFSDFKNGLMEGKSIWESFGNAAMNVLDKIVDKLLNDVIDAIFQTNDATAGAGGGGGFWSSIIGGIGKLFSAKGNVFDGGQAMAFANGGAFTNGIVNRPTAFNLGVMGEKGPEAIVPLSRGPDGSLGVQMHSANAGRQDAAKNNVQVTNQYTLSGAISEETVIARIQASAERVREDVRKSLVGDLNQYSRDGAFS